MCRARQPVSLEMKVGDGDDTELLDIQQFSVITVAHLHLQTHRLTRTAHQFFHFLFRQLTKPASSVTDGVRPSSWLSSR